LSRHLQKSLFQDGRNGLGITHLPTSHFPLITSLTHFE
jgi:hypothetical protein